MKRKKGFTLIELLAVIVILAIIALIAVPIVLNMINNAKKGAAVSSAYGYIESIENYQALAQINSNEILKEGHYNVATKTDLKDSEGNVIKSVSKINSLVKMKGKKPSAGTIDIASNQQVSGATLCINGFVVRYLNQKSEIIADDCGDMDLITDLAVEKEGWQTERKLTINYPEGNYKYYYKVSGKAKVNDALIETNKELEATNPQVLMLEENQTVETWIIKNGKKIAITTYVENMIDQIVPILPDATATSGYPMLTLLGVSTNISLDISNATEQSGTTPYYSVDNGNNWKKYTGKTNIDATSIKVVMRRDLSKSESEIVDVDIYYKGQSSIKLNINFDYLSYNACPTYDYNSSYNGIGIKDGEIYSINANTGEIKHIPGIDNALYAYTNSKTHYIVSADGQLFGYGNNSSSNPFVGMTTDEEVSRPGFI